MIPQDASTIAVKLSQAWPRSSIATDVWEEELAPLDRGRAEETVRQLRRTEEHAPSIARFLSAYRNLAGTAPIEWICPTCNNDRWITDLLHPEHNGYWTEKVNEEGKPTRTMPVFKLKDGTPDPTECICNIMRPCPRCNAPKDGVRDHG